MKHTHIMNRVKTDWHDYMLTNLPRLNWPGGDIRWYRFWVMLWHMLLLYYRHDDGNVQPQILSQVFQRKVESRNQNNNVWYVAVGRGRRWKEVMIEKERPIIWCAPSLSIDVAVRRAPWKKMKKKRRWSRTKRRPIHWFIPFHGQPYLFMVHVPNTLFVFVNVHGTDGWGCPFSRFGCC